MKYLLIPEDVSPELIFSHILYTPNGNATRLQDHQGKVILIDFWATWCIPCHESAPILEKLYQKYQKDGLSVVGISVDNNSRPVSGFVKRFNLNYTVALDPENETMSNYGVYGIPTLFLVDRQGRIRERWIGYNFELETTLEVKIQELLKEKV